MTHTELMQQIIQKQDEYIKHFKSCYYHNGINFKRGLYFFSRKAKSLEKELSDLTKQLEEYKDENPAFGQAWICPRCGKVHSWLNMSCDCQPIGITSTTYNTKPNPQDVNPYDSKAILRKRKTN